jgi:hypothetical protein
VRGPGLPAGRAWWSSGSSRAVLLTSRLAGFTVRRRSLPGAGAVKGLVRRTSKTLGRAEAPALRGLGECGGTRQRILEALTAPVEG